MMWSPKHKPPKGLEPKTMVSETPELYIYLTSNQKPKPKITAEYLDRDLHFQLNHFEEHCQGFRFCNQNNDYSRSEVIISIFVDFFLNNMEKFKTYDVDITFFLDTFKTHDTIGFFREIIQLQEPPLFDPTIYFLTVLVKCDERFGEFVAGHNVLASIIITLKNLEVNERRILKNLFNLLLSIIPYHRNLDPLYTDFTDNFDEIMAKIDEFNIYDDIKQRLVCTLTYYADPLPDFYPNFLGVVINDLTHTSLKYAFLTCASIVRKSPEFLIILIELDVINKLFETRKVALREDDTLFPTIDFALSILEGLDSLKNMDKHVFKKSQIPGQPKEAENEEETEEEEKSEVTTSKESSEKVGKSDLDTHQEEEENFDVSSVIKLSELTFEKIFSSFDYKEIREGLNSSNSQAAIASLRFVTTTLPETMHDLIVSCGNFCNLLDSITVSLRINNEEQILASLKCLQKLIGCEPKMTTQFLNLDFNDVIISLLKSDVDSYVYAIFSFFDELLDNQKAPLRSVNSFFMSLMDSGLYEVLTSLSSGKKKKIAKRTREIRTKIDDISKRTQ